MNFSLLHDPELCASSLWKRVPVYIRQTFCTAVILGLLTHLYMFTNKFTNHDDLLGMFGADYGAASGRWLLPFIEHWDGEFSMPWLIGLISVLCLAGVACFSAALLRIRRPVGCTITAALIVTFPAVATTFGYMFSASAYFISLLMTAAGTWAAVRWGWRGSILGAVAIVLSMGIYQAYFPVAAVLMVGALLFETLDGEKSFRDLFLEGLRLLATLAVSMAAYLVIVKITTRNVELTSYKGISDMGKISLRDLPGMIYWAYRKYYNFFLKNDWGYHFGFLKYAFILVGLVSFALGLLLLVHKRLGPTRTALALLLALLFPMAGNLIFLMGVQGTIFIHMLYGMLYILILPIGLAEYAGPVLQESRGHIFRVGVSWVVLLTMALTSWSYAITDNNGYMKADFAMRQCEAYSNRLAARIESCQGYKPGMSVVMLGGSITDERLSFTPQLDQTYLVGIFNMSNLRSFYSYSHFLHYFSAFPEVVYWDNSELASLACTMEEVQEMPVYPEEGSVRVINDVVVVKLNQVMQDQRPENLNE